jgi:hypothetical protein
LKASDQQLKLDAYLECAGAMCARCASGDKPRWMIVFEGYTHVWKQGNGHSKCGAGPIWQMIDSSFCFSAVEGVRSLTLRNPPDSASGSKG